MQIAHGEPLNLPAIRQRTGRLEMRQTCLNGVSLSHRWRRRRRLLVERAPRLLQNTDHHLLGMLLDFTRMDGWRAQSGN